MRVVKKMASLLTFVLFFACISNFGGSVLGAGIPLQSRLSNAVVLYVDNPVAYSKNVKTYIDTSNLELAPTIRNDRTLVPLRFVSENFGAKVGFDAATSAITVDTGKKVARFTMGSDRMLIDGKEVLMDVPVEIIGERTFIPLRKLVEDVLDKKVFFDRGVIIISDNENIIQKESERELVDEIINLFSGYSKLNINVDPRRELISVIQILSEYDKLFPGRITANDSTYKTQVMNYFSKYKDHPSISFFKNANKRVGGDLPASILVHLSAPPQLSQQVTFSENIKERIKDEKFLNDYLANLRNFAADTNFMDFYLSNLDKYQSFMEEPKKILMNSNYVSKLESYYGKKMKSYNIILSPLTSGVNFGPHIDWANGDSDTFSLLSTGKFINDIPFFGTDDNMRYTIWHVFGYSFANPLADQYWSEVEKYSSLMKTIEYNTKYANYGDNWKTCVNEHIVRAVTTRLAYREYGKKAGDAEMESHKIAGFIFIEDLCKALEEKYEKSRDTYPSLDKFYPELIEVFKKLSQK